MNLYRVENPVGGSCFQGTFKKCEEYIQKNKLSHIWRIKSNSEAIRKFEALEAQKNELWRVFQIPVFIDIKKMKLYIVEEDGSCNYIF